LLDVLIISYIAISLAALREKFHFSKPGSVTKILVGLFVLDLILNIFISMSPGSHFFGIIKLLEFAIFGFIVAQTFTKEDIPFFTYALVSSGVVSSFLAIWQLIAQHSIGGLWYFLGERTFDSSTIGISTVNLGQEILRPYASFPHPNILAFFLLTAIVFSVFRLGIEKEKTIKLLLALSVALFSIVLFLTFSRIVVVLFICFSIYAIYTKGKRNVLKIVAGLSSLIFIFSLMFRLLPLEFISRGLDLRQDLLLEALTIFKNNPYFGIGLNNFFFNQAPLVKTISPTNFQPVHNIFVLALLSLGFFGWWIFPTMFVMSIKSLTKKIRESKITNHESRNFYRGALFLLISIIIAGMFDHYFLTLEQGQIITTLIFGLSFTDFKKTS